MSSHDSDPRPLLLGGPALGLRLIVLALMAAGLMVADHRNHHLAAIRDGVATLAYPIQWAVQAPVAAWSAMRESFATKARVEASNVKLAADNLVLRLKLLRFESLEQENQRLRAVRESSARVVQRSLIAEIVRVDLDPFRQRVLINKGTRAGLFRGQAALDANGIFGQVTRAGPVSAEVILISDPEHAIPIQVNRTGARTIGLGTGRSGLLSLPYLPQNADVIVGDLLVSSGLGGVYPPGYPGRQGHGSRARSRPAAPVRRSRAARGPRSRSGNPARLVRARRRRAGARAGSETADAHRGPAGEAGAAAGCHDGPAARAVACSGPDRDAQPKLRRRRRRNRHLAEATP